MFEIQNKLRLFTLTAIIYNCFNCISWIGFKNDMWLKYNITTAFFWFLIIVLNGMIHNNNILCIVTWPYEFVIFTLIVPLIIWGVYIFLFYEMDYSYTCVIDVMNFCLTCLYFLFRLWFNFRKKPELQTNVSVSFHLGDTEIIFNPIYQC
jgi:hypothetical protein